ncbi:hypothetical protein ASG11_07065 [Sphingomonas sp. Leaf357]|uniref:TonB-dependent receptor domain-containing protein n=1 Tax=Sphingomonas sp. Leaf357 TaxID=1736350 RepID=UPI0006FC355B|nr:TonB-dependent receptor [Sphingomonas sp. Leaf357]KQS04038.1 hypothetical protein ASG11_07065 [Sphingomonas sp. Leaf357]
MNRQDVVAALGVALGLIGACAAPAAGQVTGVPVRAEPPSQDAALPGPTNGRQNYDAAYFVKYAPATALQMVERIPGFVIESVDPSVRGFGQTAGNIVINGQRPSAKGETLQTLLSRIPASRVARIEVAPGDLYGADYTGKSQVLNLILSAGGGLAGTVQASASRDYTGKVRPTGSASALIKRGKSTFSTSVTVENSQTTEEGTDRVVSVPDGRLLEFRRKVNFADEPSVAVATSWDYADGTNRTAHLNGRVFIDRFRLNQANAVTPETGSVRDDILTQRLHYDTYELGGDVTRPLAGGGLKLIGLTTRRDRLSNDESYNRVAADTIGGFTQQLKDRLTETLLRAVWSRPKLLGWTVEIGAEGVINRLASKVDLSLIDGTGMATPIALPVDDAVVKEVRGEAFVNAGRPIDSRLRIDLGVTQEMSRITVTGDAQAERSLSFLKPKATLDWRPSPLWRAQLSVQRTVAQLQFEDFISGAELSNNRVNGGNVDLLPQRAWETLATIERKLLGDGLYKLELGYNRVSLVQDRVPTPEGFDAPGNLGNGHVFIFRNRLDAPLGKLGIKGGRLTLYGSYVSTSVIDPYTLRARAFSGNSLFYGEANFRQDFKKFAWGFGLTGGTSSTYFRLDETDRNYRDVPRVTAFVEWRPDARTTLNLSVDNLTSVSGRRERTFYTPDRRTPTASSIEYRERNSHVVPLLTVKRTLG